MDRYCRNEQTLTKEQNRNLRSKKVCVIGCGGLGGFIIELLARAGVLELTVVDGDVFEESNLNRQLFSTVDNLGHSKAVAAKERIRSVNPDVHVRALDLLLTAENAHGILIGHDLVIDALDSIQTRLVLEDAAHELEIPLVHGAIGGWYGQVGISYPGDRLLHRLYPRDAQKGVEEELGNPPFTPAFVAALQVCEAIKVLIGIEPLLRNKVCRIDLLTTEMEVFEL